MAYEIKQATEEEISCGSMCGLCCYCHTEWDDMVTVCDYFNCSTDEYSICPHFNEEPPNKQED